MGVVIVVIVVVTEGKQSTPSLGFRLRLEFDNNFGLYISFSC